MSWKIDVSDIIKKDFIEFGNKWGLLIGINQYQDVIINDLNYSVNDINNFYKIIIDDKKGKYNEDNVCVLSDDKKDKPTRSNILSNLTNISRRANPEDSILFYFSGHGFEKNNMPYLLCSDSFNNTIEETAIPIIKIKQILEESLARIKIMIIDACHSGILKGIKESGIMTKAFLESLIPPPEGFVVLTSCKLNEFSFEWTEKQSSVFSHFLIEGLQGAADKNNDKIVTISEAHNYTSENVKRWAFPRGYEQSPVLEARISGDIPITFIENEYEQKIEIDKSLILSISIYSENYDSLSIVISHAEEICGSLLEYVDPEKIEKKDESYVFPYGNVSIVRSGTSYLDISFNYKKINWEKIDEIINYLAKSYTNTWEIINYLLEKKFSISKLLKKCKESEFKIVSYKPIKGEEVLTVDTSSWLGTTTTFKNEKIKTSNIMINADRYFSSDFYSFLSPENIIEFIKDCLE